MNLRQRICVLVVGMHRSGTSALTRAINLLGATLPETLLGPGPGNESGHWEPERIVLLHDRLLDELGGRWDDWGPIEVNRLEPERFAYYTSELRRLLREDFGSAPLFVLKDPRISRLMPLWRVVADAEDIDLRVAFIVRNPLEVVDSLENRKITWTDDYTRADAALLWLRYNLDAEAASRHLTRVIISYEALLCDWRSCVDKLITALGVTFHSRQDRLAPTVETFLSADQRHHTRTIEDVRVEPTTRSWIAEVYEAMKVLEVSPGSPLALQTLDRVRSALEQATPIINQLVIQKRDNFKRGAAKMEEAIASKEAEIRTLQATLAVRDRSSELSAWRIVWRQLCKHVPQLGLVVQMLRREIS